MSAEFMASGHASGRLELLLSALIPDDDEIDEAYAAASLSVLTRHDSELAEAFRVGRRMVADAVRDCLGPGSKLDPDVLLGLAGELRQAVMLGEMDPARAHHRLSAVIDEHVAE